MRWQVKGSDGTDSSPFSDRKDALDVLKWWRRDYSDATRSYRLVRLISKRERVIREMERYIHEWCDDGDSRTMSSVRTTQYWLEALKR